MINFFQILLIVHLQQEFSAFPKSNVLHNGKFNELNKGGDGDVKKRSISPALEDYLDDCGNTILLGERKSFKFTSPFYGSETSYPAGVNCQWSFIGDKTCTAELFCKELDLDETEECGEDNLVVVDGVGGSERLCGKKVFDKPIRASRGLRDLYVSFQTRKDGNDRKGFFCEAKCSANIATSRELAVTEEIKEDSRCVCGLQNIDDRIVGGSDAKMNEFPWQVAIVYPGTRSPKCGGSIINNNWVLTAAHCFRFDKSEAKDIEVLYHAKSLDMTMQKDWKDVALGLTGSIRGSGYKDKQQTDTDEKTQRFKVLEVISHDKFTAKYDYDVALLKLDRKIDLSSPDAPTPICLPDFGYENTFLGQNPVVVGWGLPDEKAGGTTRSLQKLPVPVLQTSKCQKWSQHELTARMICAGYEEGGKDACTGDSGGPLSLKRANNQWEQIGIVSWGEGCARKQKPGIYSRVTEFRQWIQKHTTGAIWCKASKS